MMPDLSLQEPFIQQILAASSNAQLDVLRLDLVHNQISGNKWFKLQGWLKEMKTSGRQAIVTFGGPYSNHLLATAVACAALDIPCKGYVRGEAPFQWSDTLKEAENTGMELEFLTRHLYKEWSRQPDRIPNIQDYLVIPEGGYGILGLSGLQHLFRVLPLQNYSHVMTAVGTGTTLAALVSESSHQQCIGIPVLKNEGTIREEINYLLHPEKQDQFFLLQDYHFGGYAKFSSVLINFMNEWYRSTRIPTDFVYTAKAFYAADSLLNEGYFPQRSRILILHTGGLQGNRSLPKGTLIF